jgi:Uma2 family endonuclease
MRYMVKKTRKKSAPEKVSENGLITFEQYYELVDEKTRADLLDGKIIRDSPAIPRHAFLVTWIGRLIGVFNEKRQIGEVLGATATVRLTPYNAPEPDIFFIRKERLVIVKDQYVDGPPDLCVEVISKSSRKYDRGRKFVLYAEQGVREYWIIDPFRGTVEFFENRAGEFVPIAPDEHGRFHSRVLPGLWLKPEWLTANPLPPVLDVLREILGEEKPLI